MTRKTFKPAVFLSLLSRSSKGGRKERSPSFHMDHRQDLAQENSPTSLIALMMLFPEGGFGMAGDQKHEEYRDHPKEGKCLKRRSWELTNMLMPT